MKTTLTVVIKNSVNGDLVIKTKRYDGVAFSFAALRFADRAASRLTKKTGVKWQPLVCLYNNHDYSHRGGTHAG